MRTFKIFSLSNFQISNIVLLTIVTNYIPMTYFTTGSVYLLTSTHFIYSLFNDQSVLCIHNLGFILFCFFKKFISTYKWDHVVFVFLCLTYSLSTMPSKCIHVANGEISLLLILPLLTVGFISWSWVAAPATSTPSAFHQEDREMGREDT